MTPEEAFLKDIFANPDDLSIPLIFADWLEEQGDPRGKLLRTQLPFVERYQMERILSRDAYWEEWLAEDRERGEQVRLKMGHEYHSESGWNAWQGIWEEGKALAQLHHPAIPTVLNIGFHGNRSFLTFPDWSMARLCDSGARSDEPWVSLAVADRMAIAIQVADALKLAHSHGILHGDLGPKYVHWSTEERRALLTGWEFNSLRGPWLRAEEGAVPIMGTPHHFPPEALLHEAPRCTVLRDIYGFGVVLYYLLTGRHPVQASTLAEIVHAVLEAQPEAPSHSNSECPRELETICLKCLEKDPKDRYQNMDAILEDLTGWLEGSFQVPGSSGPLRRFWRWWREWLQGS